jgi:hypothetical protein
MNTRRADPKGGQRQTKIDVCIPHSYINATMRSKLYILASIACVVAGFAFFAYGHESSLLMILGCVLETAGIVNLCIILCLCKPPPEPPVAQAVDLFNPKEHVYITHIVVGNPVGGPAFLRPPPPLPSP